MALERRDLDRAGRAVEWTWGDVQDLLQTEIGPPREEARSITETFLEAARAEGHEQAEPGSNIVGIAIVCSLLGLLGLGVLTVGIF